MSRIIILAALAAGLAGPARAQWSVEQLSVARSHLAAAVIGDRAFFGGGRSGAGGAHLATVDIYDTLAEAWTTANLSVARDSLAAAATGDYVLFAGGGAASGVVATVDLYNATTDAWTTATLSAPRWYLSGAATETHALFAGGINSSGSAQYATVDIFES